MSEFFDYYPARLAEGKEWYISYYAKNPQTARLCRKKIKLNRIKSITERRKMIIEINNKLASGWNPYIEQEAPNSFHKATEVFKNFLNVKKKENKKTSFQSYSSYIEIFNKFLEKEKLSDLIIINFNNQVANKFMNYIFLERNVSNRTYNNYRDFGISLFNWAIENLYCKANPFKPVRYKKNERKKRIIIDYETRVKIKDYLIENNHIEYYTICLLCYNCFLRPIEIMQLKKHNFNLENNTLILEPEITKDNDYRYITITENLKYYLLKLDLENIHPDSYIFSENYKPGRLLYSSKNIPKFWFKMRKELNLKSEIQFYSLKDTGIVNMLRAGVSPDIVRDQAGHSSLEITNEYVQLANQKASKEIIDKMKDF